MDFKIGDQVIYPNQGVGSIEEICTTSIGGEEAEFYRLRLAATNSLVLVPVANADSVGVRRLSTEKELDALLKVLKRDAIETAQDWKDRYKDNVEKMMTGSIVEVARVLKSLYFLSFQKPLSFREKKMYDRARQLVVSEIATVQDKEPGDVEVELDQILTEAFERLEAEPVSP